MYIILKYNVFVLVYTSTFQIVLVYVRDVVKNVKCQCLYLYVHVILVLLCVMLANHVFLLQSINCNCCHLILV